MAEPCARAVDWVIKVAILTRFGELDAPADQWRPVWAEARALVAA